jgi:hypothetical protein
VLTGGADVVVVGLVVGVAVVVGAPEVLGAVEVPLAALPGAGSSSAFAIWVEPLASETGSVLAFNWVARVALPATTAPMATATSIARTAELRRGDPFTDGDRTTTE